MKVKIADKEFKLSKAQSEVVQTLLNNRGNENVFIAPTRFYNHQSILDLDREPKLFKQFKRPTLEWLVKREILVPNGTRDYLQLNPLAHRIF